MEFGMKNIFLKPHVHKVKGVQNYCLYDLLNEEVVQVITQGSVEDLKRNLLENNLIFETNGVVPCKIAIPAEVINATVKNSLGVVHLHLSGCIGQTCWERVSCVNHDGPAMTEQILDEILGQIGKFPIERVQVYFANISTVQLEKIVKVKSIGHIDLYPVDGEGKEGLLGSIESFDSRIRVFHEPNVDPQNKGVDLFAFEKNKFFNPCLANQIAFSVTGDIKPCLWFAKSMGNVLDEDFVKVIREQIYEPYWKLSKDKIDDCKSCEFRYACFDCRVGANGEVNEGGKPFFCSYDPTLGIEYIG